MAYNNLILEKEDRLAVLTINRPPVNALSPETLEEIQRALEELREDAAIRAVIITGAGEHMFIAGADVTGFLGMDPEKGLGVIELGQKLFSSIETYPKPVIAAINGACLGGGLELAMACDVRIAAEKARFGQPEIKLGIMPGWGGTQRLPRLIGRGRAQELLLTGEMIKASEALRYGLVNRVVPDSELMTAAREMAKKLAEQPPLAIAAIKEAVALGLDTTLEEGLKIEGERFARVFATEDALEGISAFVQKRKPEFKGK